MSDPVPDPEASTPEANGGAAGPPVPAVLTSAKQSLDQQLVERVQAQFSGLTAGPSSASSNGTSSSTALSTSAASSSSRSSKRANKERYAFWETQPVTQFNQDAASLPDGPIDAPKTVAQVKQEPYNLPEGFEWCETDVMNDAECKEVYDLLHHNYVEDDDNMFRFNYSPSFINWSLCPPGFRKEWHVGVRVTKTRKLVAFISAIPAHVMVDGVRMPMVEINFLCVHKKLRAKRLAPVMIKEITRRVNLQNVWQAVYTAGIVIPKPLAVTRYWHRSLNPKKLIEVGFSQLQPRMTMARTIKLYKLPAHPLTPGLRPLHPSDVAGVAALLNSYLPRYRLTLHFTEEEVAHWLNPRQNVIDAYVVQEEGSGKVVSLVSFYTLPSSVLGHPEHKELKAAYMFYTVPGPTPIADLMNDALILAAAKGYDVFNSLDIMQNEEWLKELKFGPGDGNLQYYTYNYRVARTLQPSDVGLILM